MILLKSLYQKNTDIFEQVYKNAGPEYQVLIEKMLSVYHMSYEQAEAAV